MCFMGILMGLLHPEKLVFLVPEDYLVFYPHITGTTPAGVAVHTMACDCFTVRMGIVCHSYFMSVKRVLLPMFIGLQKHHIHR